MLVRVLPVDAPWICILHVVHRIHFACVNSYIFANCSQTPASTSNLSTSSETQWNVDSNNTEILSTFHVRVEYISVWKIYHSAHSNQWGHKCWKIPKTAPSFWGTWIPSKTWMPGVTSLTTPNDSLIMARTFAQLCNRVPTGYNGTPNSPPKTAPSPLTITTPI